MEVGHGAEAWRLVMGRVDGLAAADGHEQRVAILGALMTACVPMLPPAPGLFSTTALPPSFGELLRHHAAHDVVQPPAAWGTTITMGRLGRRLARKSPGGGQGSPSGRRRQRTGRGG